MNQINKSYNFDPNCIFCKIIQKEIPAATIYEDSDSLAFLDRNPINPGHTLLIPKVHQDHIWDLDDKNYHYLFEVSKKIKIALEKTYSSPRIGLVVEGFGVAHTHLHIIPIYQGEDLKKPQPPADPEDLIKEASKIKANF